MFYIFNHPIKMINISIKKIDFKFISKYLIEGVKVDNFRIIN